MCPKRVGRRRENLRSGPASAHQPSPNELGQEFVVPLLCVEEDGDLFVFESTFLLEFPWRLGQKDASLSDTYNPLKRPTGKAGVVDVSERNRITTGLMEEHEDFVGTPAQVDLSARQFPGDKVPPDSCDFSARRSSSGVVRFLGFKDPRRMRVGGLSHSWACLLGGWVPDVSHSRNHSDVW